MIDPSLFFEGLRKNDIKTFYGVPDSLLKDFCAFVDDNVKEGEHIITANEGNAVAIAAGYHISTKKIACVYMQNSGLGNCINPLTSLADPAVYKIPILLIVGWRGEPNEKDEPQHVKQGAITKDQLDLLGIPFYLLESNSNVDYLLEAAVSKIKETNAPVAILVKKGAFVKYGSKRKENFKYTMKREDALRTLLGLVGDDLIVSTTGKTSREVFELRIELGLKQRDFLTVGGMGHTSSIALGVALGQPNRRVFCIDGDGSIIMHLGAVPIIGDISPKNFVHILLNNSSHESVGGQRTVADKIDFESIALASGYVDYLQATDEISLINAWRKLEVSEGPILFEIKICQGSRDDLGRPTSTPEENKIAFMENLSL